MDQDDRREAPTPHDARGRPLSSEGGPPDGDERYRDLLETTSDFIWEMDAEGRYTYCSPQMQALWGFDPRSMVGKTPLDLMPPEERGLASEVLAKLLAWPQPFRQLELTAYDAHGQRVYVEVSGVPFFDSNGTFLGFRGVTRDVTDRRRAEAALRESAERFQQLVESYAQAAWETDANGVVVADSPTWRGYTGQSFEEWVGYGWLNAVHPDDRAYAERHWRAAIAARQNVDAEFRLWHAASRTWRWTNVRAVPLTAPDGTIRKWVAMNVDVDDRNRAEDALRASEQKYRALVTAGAYATYRMSPDWGEMLEFNGRGFMADIRTPTREWAESFVHPEDRERVRDAIREAIREKRAFELEYRVFRPDGRVGWTSSRAVPLLDGSRQVLEWFGAAGDITARKEAEALQAADLRDAQRLRALGARLLTESSLTALYDQVLDTAIELTHADAGTIQILDDETAELVLFATRGFDRSLTDHFRRVDARSGSPCGLALASGTRSLVDFDDLADPDLDGSRRLHREAGYSSGQSTPLLSRSGRPIGMLSTHWREHHRPSDRELRFLDLLARQAADVIDTMRVQEQLRRAHAELEDRVRLRTAELARTVSALEEEVRERRAAEAEIKALVRRLVSIQEEERRRIARDLHDQLGQQMTALRMSLEASDGLPDAALAERAARARRLAEELDQSIDFLTWELRPAALEHLGLAAALENLVSGWASRFGIPAEFHGPGSKPLALPADVEVNLYRLVQEALHNVLKHADASGVSVILERRDHELVLVIEDDGRGFDPAEARAPSPDGGLGLIGMRERAGMLGGTIEIESAPGQGTTVFVRIPV